MNELKLRDVKKVDVAIITIREDEYEAVLARFKSRRPVTGGRHIYEYCDFRTRSNQLSIVIARTVEQGHTAVQAVTHDIIEDLHPHFLVLTGIAGGVPHDEFSL